MYGPLLACFIMLAGIFSKNVLVKQHGDANMKLCPQEDPVKDKNEVLITRGRDQVLEPKEVNTELDKIGVQQFEVKQPKPQMLKACSMESVELMKNEEGAIDSTAPATVQELSTQELKESKQEHERIENLDNYIQHMCNSPAASHNPFEQVPNPGLSLK